MVEAPTCGVRIVESFAASISHNGYSVWSALKLP